MMFGILVAIDMISHLVWFLLLGNGKTTLLKKPSMKMYIVGIGMMYIVVNGMMFLVIATSVVQGYNELSSFLAVISVIINIAIIAIALFGN